MATKAKIAREKQRQALVIKYAAKRAELKAGCTTAARKPVVRAACTATSSFHASFCARRPTRANFQD
jgi:hypothetical protein